MVNKPLYFQVFSIPFLIGPSLPDGLLPSSFYCSSLLHFVDQNMLQIHTFHVVNYYYLISLSICQLLKKIENYKIHKNKKKIKIDFIFLLLQIHESLKPLKSMKSLCRYMKSAIATSSSDNMSVDMKKKKRNKEINVVGALRRHPKGRGDFFFGYIFLKWKA